MSEKIYIRADANDKLGMGHLMRCMAIAEQIIKMGGTVKFIVADSNSAILLKDRGYDWINLRSEWCNLDCEINKVKGLIKKENIKKLLIDHYYVSEKYLKELNQITEIIYIDDVNSFCYPVNKLINYNIYAEDLDYRNRYAIKKINTEFFLGTKFAPLRLEFQQMDNRVYRGINKILLSSGGSDNYNMLGNIIEKLRLE